MTPRPARVAPTLVPAPLAAPRAPGAIAVPRSARKVGTPVTETGMEDFGVNRPLPLDMTVTGVVTPGKPGTHRLASGMDGIAGELRVQ